MSFKQKLSDSKENDLYTRIGYTLVRLQGAEFVIHATISHFNTEILSKDRRFKNLNPQNFLSDTEEGVKSRKQTLGLLFEVLKKEAPIFNEDKLEDFLTNRNKFIHNFWREEVGKNYGAKGWTAKPTEFVEKLGKEADEWKRIFKGFLFVLMKIKAEMLGAEDKIMPVIKELEPFAKEFLNNVSLKKPEAS